MAQTRQSRPDSGLGLQVKDLQPFQVVPSSLGSGLRVLALKILSQPRVLIVSQPCDRGHVCGHSPTRFRVYRAEWRMAPCCCLEVGAILVSGSYRSVRWAEDGAAARLVQPRVPPESVEQFNSNENGLVNGIPALIKLS